LRTPQRRSTEKRPFESWDELEALAVRLRGCLGPMVIFAAATGLRPGEWVALEQRDVDREARVVYVLRSFGKGRIKCTKTEASVRGVPLQAFALAVLDQLPVGCVNPVRLELAANVVCDRLLGLSRRSASRLHIDKERSRPPPTARRTVRRMPPVGPSI